MIRIESTCELGRSYSAKREKDDDDSEVVNSHLKFSDLFVTRDQLDELCSQPNGWSTGIGFLFDEYGAPVAPLTLSPDGREFSVVGRITGPEGHPSLPLVQARLANISFTLTKNGATMSGALAWSVRGDEAEDVTELLGRLCRAEFDLRDSEQQDLLKNVTVTIESASRT